MILRLDNLPKATSHTNCKHYRVWLWGTTLGMFIISTLNKARTVSLDIYHNHSLLTIAKHNRSLSTINYHRSELSIRCLELISQAPIRCPELISRAPHNTWSSRWQKNTSYVQFIQNLSKLWPFENIGNWLFCPISLKYPISGYT